MPSQNRSHYRSLPDLDRALSEDRILCAVAGLFPLPQSTEHQIENPSLLVRPRSLVRAAAIVRAPEVIAIAAVTVLTTCSLLGIVLGNGAIALLGVVGTLALGICCHFAIRSRQPAKTTDGAASSVR